MKSVFEDRIERQYWSEIFQRTFQKDVEITWWDYQWFFACITRSGLTALPNNNLVSNVGFGEDATHTTKVEEPTVADKGLSEFISPTFLLRDLEADRYTYDHSFGGAARRRKQQLLPRIQTRLRHHWKQLKAVLK